MQDSEPFEFFSHFTRTKIPASQLGIKEYLPAYLGTKLSREDLLTGVNFASGGSGYDPQTARLVSVLSATDQLNLFKEYKEKLKIIAGEERAADIITKSIYLVVLGTNDLSTTYFTMQLRKLEYDLPSYIKFVVQQASSFYQELYESGARKIGVIGIPPIGSLPSKRTSAGGIKRDSVPLYNEASMMLNRELSLEIQRLNSKLPGSRIVYIDIYTPLLDMISNPSAYGFEVSTLGCCGTGTFEVTLTCNKLTTDVCDDVSKYLFWDSYHPTERAYQILVTEMLQKYGSLFN
ncbi:GDSL esterase/lipase EXL3-like [Asparagus officinalis]|uniref:GDSL esterase/lipase EXL3-like n=1 Tax=Asparagus officinalis TaxID=4686 RepID=UPI00098E846D|nr:GDSL esterase/lipase EXL3-like [Asparagus officinalis]XP_020261596.1 GDSL esterase/lipase EXL3-like [Asparagus officinalis]